MPCLYIAKGLFCLTLRFLSIWVKQNGQILAHVLDRWHYWLGNMGMFFNLTCCWKKSEGTHIADSHLAIPWQFHSIQEHIAHRSPQRCGAGSSARKGRKRPGFHFPRTLMWFIIKLSTLTIHTHTHTQYTQYTLTLCHWQNTCFLMWIF